MAVFNGVSIAVFFCTLLVFSRFYARFQDSKAQAQIENDILTDLRARDVNHLIDAIPRCVATCIFPGNLDRGCAHSDYKCICENLRAIDEPPPVVEENSHASKGRGGLLSLLLPAVHKEEDNSFRVCVDECSLQEQIYAPAVVIKLCYNMGVPFKPNSSESLAPFAKRFVAVSSGVSAIIQSTTSLAPSSTSDPASLATTTNSMPTSAESGVMSATNNSSNSGLSLGAKIGIAVAIPVVLILLAIAAFWYFRRRHHKNSPSATAEETHEVDGGQIPVEVGGEPISELDSNTNITNIMPRPYSFEHNQSTTEDSKTAFGSDIISGLPSPMTSPTTASFARRTLSPISPSPFPPPWETDQSEVAYHLLQRPLGSPSLPSPTSPDTKTQSPQIQSPQTQTPKTQSPKTPSPKTPSPKTPSSQIQIPPPSAQIIRPQNLPAAMSASRSEDAELLRLEAEIAQVREKKERLRYLAELEAREEELLRNIEERRDRKSVV